MTIKWHSLLFLSVLFLAACGSIEEVPTPRPPTITPTPISTELPAIETAIPAGFSDDNPIQIVIVPADPEQATERLAEFEAALSELTDIAITVVLAETQQEAFALVCGAASGTLSAAWVDGMTYAATNLQGCGVGVLQADTPEGTGETGVLLLNIEYEEDGIAGAVEDSLCRISADDFFSWTLPVLFYGAEGFTVADIEDVNEVDDNDALIADVASGRCAAVGMSEEAWEAYLDADEDGTLAENVIIAATSPEFPYQVFSFPFAMSLDAIADVEAALLQMDIISGRSEGDTVENAPTVDEDLMLAFFGEGAFEAVEAVDFAEVIEFLESSGINFSELAN